MNLMVLAVGALANQMRSSALHGCDWPGRLRLKPLNLQKPYKHHFLEVVLIGIPLIKPLVVLAKATVENRINENFMFFIELDFKF